jgi:ubiquinone/menaquinone biosynthesis C-methylase UbiE
LLATRLALSGAAVVGIDASASMVAAARERASAVGAAVGFCQGTAEALPFPDGSFDLVVAVTVLCFIDDPLPTFREAHRVLAPGGRLVIGELGRFSSWAVQRRVRAWLGDPVWSSARFRTAHELRRTARLAGFSVTSLRGAVFYPRMVWLARLMRHMDSRLGRHTTFGAAFICMAADR